MVKEQPSQRKASTLIYQALCEKEVGTLKGQVNLCNFRTAMQKYDRNGGQLKGDKLTGEEEASCVLSLLLVPSNGFRECSTRGDSVRRKDEGQE